jgi:2-desacetyl-2-hydroxyethyl bacteriochlorophyllide A dehydrogenase
VLDGPRDLRVDETETTALGPREVRIRALLSAISHGTELNLYRGTSAFAERVFDRELRAFVAPDPPRPTYPATLGYELVGRVAEIGADVTEFRPGELVHAGAPHGDEAVIDVDVSARSTYPLVRLPEDTDAPSERWLFVSLGAVALVAVHDARIKLGDHVVVIGLGAIGLLVVQMARMAGAARITTVDPVAARRDLALGLGADAALDPFAARDGAGAESKRLGGRGADVAIETSGVTAGVHDAMAAAGLGGRVVLLGFYQGGAPEVRFGEEWHHNRLDLVSSMGAWGAPHRDHPSWHRARVMETVVDLLAGGRLQVDGLPVRSFTFEQVVDAFAWLDEHPSEAVKVALAYDGINPS